MKIRLLPVCLMLFIAMASPYDSLDAQTRHNGLEWLNYGPAVITAGKAVEVTLQVGDQRIERMIIEERQLQRIKQWLREHFNQSLNRSPVKPTNRAEIYPNVITVYATREAKAEDMLLEIPLTPFTLNLNGQEYAKQLQILKALVTAK